MSDRDKCLLEIIRAADVLRANVQHINADHDRGCAGCDAIAAYDAATQGIDREPAPAQENAGHCSALVADRTRYAGGFRACGLPKPCPKHHAPPAQGETGGEGER